MGDVIRPVYPAGPAAEAAARSFLTQRSLGIRSPEILRIAWQVRALTAAGEREVFDLTLGDYDPAQFAPPPSLVSGTSRHLAAGRTDYPPADGIPSLRRAIADYYERRLGLRFPDEAILVGSGARPLIYALYASTLEPGDRLVYAVPSWNNDYYAYLNGAEAAIVEATPADRFLPTLEALAPHLESARVLHLNNPLNPAGTVMAPAELGAICQAVVSENRRRAAAGARALILLYDMVYWPLVYGASEFHHPVALVPEVAPFVVSIDAVSKWMAATGLRVGWAVVPPFAQAKVKALGSHMGAWAPHAEQWAVAEVLSGDSSFEDYVVTLAAALEERLAILHAVCTELATEGYEVEALAPESGLYLSLRLDLVGAKTPDGERLKDGEAVRRYLLDQGGVGLIPFTAFGSSAGGSWYRASIGAIDCARLRAAGAALAAAVRGLSV
jgi:aspartate aminotransferase